MPARCCDRWCLSASKKNPKLHGQLAEGMGQRYSSQAGGPWVPTLTLPFDGNLLTQLYQFIGPGLAFGTGTSCYRQKPVLVRAAFIRNDMSAFQQLLTRPAHQGVQKTLANGMFVYEGAQAEKPRADNLEDVARRRGVSHGPGRPNGYAAYVLTAPKSMPAALEIVLMLDW